MSKKVDAYMIKNDMVHLFNDKGTHIRSINGKGVTDVRVNSNGEFDIYRNGTREHFDANIVKRRTYC